MSCRRRRRTRSTGCRAPAGAGRYSMSWRPRATARAPGSPLRECLSQLEIVSFIRFPFWVDGACIIPSFTVGVPCGVLRNPDSDGGDRTLEHISGAFAELDLHLNAAAASEHGQIESIAGVFPAERARHGVHLGHLLAVDRGDEIAADADFLIADQHQPAGAAQAGR